MVDTLTTEVVIVFPYFTVKRFDKILSQFEFVDIFSKMNRGRPPTGNRSASGIIGPQIVERPMTQHGLGGMKTPKTSFGSRQVQDKSFWLGQIRSKMNELSEEIHTLETEMTDQDSVINIWAPPGANKFYKDFFYNSTDGVSLCLQIA
jgi:hypothetical protein